MLQYYFYRYFYGRYSSKLHDLCEQNNFQTPYDLCFAEDVSDRIQMPYFQDKNLLCYETTEHIDFEKITFFSSFKSIKKRFGNPGSFLVASSDGNDVKVYGYKKKSGGTKVKIYTYFLNNQFFMGEYCYQDYSTATLHTILMKLAREYNITKKLDSARFYIQDNHSAIIYFEDNGFSFSVRYISKANNSLNSKLEASFIRQTATANASHSN